MAFFSPFWFAECPFLPVLFSFSSSQPHLRVPFCDITNKSCGPVRAVTTQVTQHIHNSVSHKSQELLPEAEAIEEITCRVASNEDGTVAMEEVENVGWVNEGDHLGAHHLAEHHLGAQVNKINDELCAEMLRQTHGCEPYLFF